METKHVLVEFAESLEIESPALTPPKVVAPKEVSSKDAELAAKALKPVAITGSGQDISAEKYGGKAYGLYRLRTIGCLVPDTWVYPARAQKTLPIVMLMPGWQMGEYAVRSGAPVSMPGMMQTLLNLNYAKIPEAMAQVWKSYHTPHCTSYREQNKISHDIGTAVIIQRMVKAKYSGVAFTQNPNKPKGGFDPVVEGVKGFGDKLVGGTASAEALPANVMEDVWVGLYNIYKNLGHSDVEWVRDAQDRIFWVQHRELKFAKHDDAADSGAFKGLSICSGQAIGAPSIIQIDAKDILIVNEFTPEDYQKMLGAKAIMCRTGGLTCHAAIVGRTLGLPVISSFKLTDNWFVLKESYPKLIFDGRSGRVCVPGTGPTPEIITTKPTSFVEPPIQAPSHAVTTHDWNASDLLRFFYCNMDSPDDVADVAKIIASYLYFACLGELRHCAKYSIGHQTDYSILISEFKKLGIRLDSGGCGRSTFVKAYCRPPASLEESISSTRLMVKAFSSLGWSVPNTNTGYGGAKWAGIAQTLLDYLEGRHSAILFVDQTFNLQHNSSTVFGKFDWMMAGNISAWLDIKRAASSLIPPSTLKSPLSFYWKKAAPPAAPEDDDDPEDSPSPTDDEVHDYEGIDDDDDEGECDE